MAGFALEKLDLSIEALFSTLGRAALQDNHQLHDPKQPMEILRTIHSFDPCIACAVHLSDEAGDEMVRVKIT